MTEEFPHFISISKPAQHHFFSSSHPGRFHNKWDAIYTAFSRFLGFTAVRSRSAGAGWHNITAPALAGGSSFALALHFPAFPTIISCYLLWIALLVVIFEQFQLISIIAYVVRVFLSTSRTPRELTFKHTSTAVLFSNLLFQSATVWPEQRPSVSTKIEVFRVLNKFGLKIYAIAEGSCVKNDPFIE
jgi:hypothetical protein